VQEVDLRAAAEPDEKCGRARRQVDDGQRPPPVLALDARPVAVERQDRENIAGDDEPPLTPPVDDPDPVRPARARLVDRPRAAPANQRGCMRMAPSSRIVSPFNMAFS
jgi:hypothetical protein